MSATGLARSASPDIAYRVRGRIERVEANVAVGWVFDASDPTCTIPIEIRVDGQPVGQGIADVHQERLANAGFGDGRHGFRIELAVPHQDGRAVELVLHDAREGLPITAPSYRVHALNPIWIEPRELGARTVRGVPAATSTIEAPAPVRTVSDWTAPARKRGKRIWKKVRNRTVRRRVVPIQPKPPSVDLEAGFLVDGLANGAANQEIGPRLEHAAPWSPLLLPDVDAPEVSVIIPVHNQFPLTYQCLLSIVLAETSTPFEVILVDDRSSDTTRDIESVVENLRVVRNAENLGFLHSCRAGVDAAKGSYFLFLNNDTVVEPGWIDELRDVFNRFQYVGAAGAKLVYPDGRLQDAGGIVWETGVPWNVGHGADPNDPRFNYVRDVDYLTGAALMVSREAWNSVGGFTEDYAPAYYEDTDLAFKLREAGYRTLYCPQAVATHFEGGSHGTSLETGGKRYQVVNAKRFVDTWRDRFSGLGAEGVDLHREKDRRVGFRVLMIDNAFPRLGEDAGSYAAIQEASMLQSLGAKITFLPINLLYLGKHVDELQRRGIECVHARSVASAERFFMDRGGEFDLVYVTRYTVAEKILPLARRYSSAKVIFNNADLHFLRELRQAIVAGKSDRSAELRTRTRELAVMNSVDAVLTYSDTESHIIASHLMRDDHVFRCPWVLPAREDEVSASERSGLCFLGGFAHPPNREGVDWFLRNVWHQLSKHYPELTFDIWGSRIPSDVDWGMCPGVRIRGYANTLDDVFSTTRVFVAPLLSGAGVKGKVLDSISYGVPAVLTPTAAESTGLVHGASTFVARTEGEWFESVCRLLEDDETWVRMHEAVRVVRQQEYSFGAGRSGMRSILQSLGNIVL